MSDSASGRPSTVRGLMAFLFTLLVRAGALVGQTSEEQAKSGILPAEQIVWNFQKLLRCMLVVLCFTSAFLQKHKLFEWDVTANCGFLLGFSAGRHYFRCTQRAPSHGPEAPALAPLVRPQAVSPEAEDGETTQRHNDASDDDQPKSSFASERSLSREVDHGPMFRCYASRCLLGFLVASALECWLLSYWEAGILGSRDDEVDVFRLYPGFPRKQSPSAVPRPYFQSWTPDFSRWRLRRLILGSWRDLFYFVLLYVPLYPFSFGAFIGSLFLLARWKRGNKDPEVARNWVMTSGFFNVLEWFCSGLFSYLSLLTAQRAYFYLSCLLICWECRRLEERANDFARQFPQLSPRQRSNLGPTWKWCKGEKLHNTVMDLLPRNWAEHWGHSTKLQLEVVMQRQHAEDWFRYLQHNIDTGRRDACICVFHLRFAAKSHVLALSVLTLLTLPQTPPNPPLFDLPSQLSEPRAPPLGAGAAPMVIASVFTEQKPPGGSSFGGNFSKTAFAAYVFPKGRQLQRDGTQRVEHREQRQITGLVDPNLCQSAHMAYSMSRRFPTERLLSNYAQHAEGGVKLATFVTKKPSKRVMSTPVLPPVEVPPEEEEVPPEVEEEAEEMELTEEMAAKAMNGKYYPHPSLMRGTLKLSRPKALAYGVDPGKDHGHECPFFEGAKHRFKDVQSLPEAQLRESTRSLKWKSDENWNNQSMHASLKITHFR
eukprot:g7204.t2